MAPLRCEAFSAVISRLSVSVYSYCRRVVAMAALIVWAGIVGRPDDLVGGNCVWLKEGNPGV